MANSDTRSAWHQIQDGVRDTERLITQNDYNLAMIKARQTLEVIIKQLSGQTGESDPNLADLIDSLYTDNIISKTSCEHYHKIRAIGNKAVHENNNDAYNANVSYSLLSEEVQTFIREYSPRKKSNASAAAVKPERSERTTRSGIKGERGARAKTYTGRRTVHSKKKSSINTPDLIKVIIGFIILIVLILLFRAINPLKGNKSQVTTAPTVSAESSDTAEISQEEVTETTAAVAYITTARLNVRSAPSTDGDVLTVLGNGAAVEYAGKYDSTWSIINYNGGQAYVATAYIKPAP